MEYRVLGPLSVYAAGEEQRLGGPRQQMVLAVLLSQANHTVAQDSLIEAVWAGDPPPAAKSTLQSYVYGLRQQLGSEAIARHGSGYRVAVDDQRMDALRFERIVNEAGQRLQADPVAARSLLVDALALWFGSPYGDLGSEPALAGEVTRLEELRLVAVEQRIEADLATGNHRLVVGELDTLVRDQPYREKLAGLHMLALYRSGRQADALEAFRRCRRRLVDELGIDPSAELRDLEERLLGQDPDLLLDVEAPTRALDGDASRAIRGYELREAIGEGDFGVVYRAFQPSVGREVAVKRVRPKYANQLSFVRLFEAEAQLVAQLEHPHIVALYDFWRGPDGAYLVMPYLRGRGLADALRHGPWNLEPALRLLDQLGSAIGFAHRHGVVHRDIKPANVLLDEDGNAYLSDFGIAPRLVDDSGAPVTNSLAYVPPEEARGEPLTHRSDIYSLGVLIFELLTGTRPSGRGPLPRLADARIGLPPELDDVLRRATDDSPATRHERVDDLLRAVRRAVGADVVAMPRPELAPSAALIRNPYKGLRAFLETDALDFHGRGAVVDELLAAVGKHRLVAVVGPSGSGKSSVVRAGLVPVVRAGGLPGSRGWPVTDMFPGSYPFEELEAALLRVATERPGELVSELSADAFGLLRISKQMLPADDSVLLLVIDQFEELFTPAVPEDTRRMFLDNLLAAAGDEGSRIRVVLTLRGDFFDRPLGYPEFAEVFSEGLVTISPLSDEGLAQAIAAPARSVGLDLEPGLVRRIVGDVEGQAGGLPLLQYALTELFNHRDGNLLTIAGYDATGGVVGALGRRAEEIFDHASPSGQEAIRQLFLRLVTVDEMARDTRRRVRQSELRTLAVDQRALDRALEQLGSFRLVTYDRDPVTRGPTVEVAHEALLWEWDRLRDWVDAHRDHLVFHSRLAASARDWMDADRDSSFLLRGGRLDQAQRWADTAGIATTKSEASYLAASRELRDAEATTSRRRRRVVLVGLLVAVLVTTSLAGVAVVQRDRAEREVLTTSVRQLASAAEAALADDPELAILLALEAVESSRRAGTQPLPDAVAALHSAVQSSRLELRLDEGHRKVAVSPDGSLLITDTLDREATRSANDVLTRDADTGEELRVLPGWAPVAGLALSPDGRRLAVGYRRWQQADNGVIVVWEPTTGRQVARYEAGDPVGWSPDGELLLTAGPTDSDIAVTVIDPGTGEVLSGLSIQQWGGAGFVDTSTLAVADPEGARISLHDALSGDVIEHLDLAGARPVGLAVDHVRNRLIVGISEPEAIQVWDLGSRSLVWTSLASQGALPVAVSPATGAVASAGSDGQVRVHDSEDGTVWLTLDGHAGAVDAIAFLPPGDRLASVGLDGETRVWDVSAGGASSTGAIEVGLAQPHGIFVSPDGREIGVGTEGSFRRFELDTGQPVGRSLAGQINWWEPSPVSADWRLVAFVDTDRKGWVQDLATGDVVATLPPCVHPRGFNADGSALVLDGVFHCDRSSAPPEAELRSRVVDPITGTELLDLGERGLLGAFAAVFNPAGEFETGRFLAVNLVDIDLVEIHDMTTGELVVTMEFQADIPLTLAFDPTGRHLAGGTQNGRAWVLDVAAALDGVPVADALVFDQVVGAGAVGAHLNADGVLATTLFGALRLWDVETGQRLMEIAVDTDDHAFAAFGPSGDELFYADGNPGTGFVIRRFPVDIDRLVDLARSRVTRDFTDDECRRFLGSTTCR